MPSFLISMVRDLLVENCIAPKLIELRGERLNLDYTLFTLVGRFYSLIWRFAMCSNTRSTMPLLLSGLSL